MSAASGDPLAGVVAEAGRGEESPFRSPRRLRAMLAPSPSISSAICLLERVAVPSFIMAAVSIGQPGQIRGIVQRARAQNDQPRRHQRQPMIFQHQHREAVWQLHLSGLGKLDAQDFVRDGRFVLALHFAERNALEPAPADPARTQTAKAASGADRALR